jgi:hypothetical protein
MKFESLSFMELILLISEIPFTEISAKPGSLMRKMNLQKCHRILEKYAKEDNVGRALHFIPSL